MRGPTFFIIGAAKAATTSLSSLLACHPDAAIVRGKESHFFSLDSRYALGFEYYSSLYDHAEGKKAIGDASTSHSRLRQYPAVPLRIKAFVPDAQFVYMVRHPLRRIEAAYAEWAATPGPRRLWSLQDALRRNPMLVDSSRYYEVFARYADTFGEERIKVVWFEEYIASQTLVYQGVCRFLGIRDTVKPFLAREQRNSRSDLAGRVAALGGRAAALAEVLDGELKRWVSEQLRDDSLQFLKVFNRPADFWSDYL